MLTDLTKEQQLALLKANSTRPSTKEDLMEQVCAFVSARYDSQPPAASRMNELNRRFGVLSKGFGLTCSELIAQLVEADRLIIWRYRDSMLVGDAAKHKAYLAPYQLDFDVLERMEHSISKQAFPAVEPGAFKE